MGRSGLKIFDRVWPSLEKLGWNDESFEYFNVPFGYSRSLIKACLSPSACRKSIAVCQWLSTFPTSFHARIHRSNPNVSFLILSDRGPDEGEETFGDHSEIKRSALEKGIPRGWDINCNNGIRIFDSRRSETFFFHQESWLETSELSLEHKYIREETIEDCWIDRPLGLGIPDSRKATAPVKQRARGEGGCRDLDSSSEYRSPLLLVRRRPPLESSETTLVTLFRLRYRPFHNG